MLNCLSNKKCIEKKQNAKGTTTNESKIYLIKWLNTANSIGISFMINYYRPFDYNQLPLNNLLAHPLMHELL